MSKLSYAEIKKIWLENEQFIYDWNWRQKPLLRIAQKPILDFSRPFNNVDEISSIKIAEFIMEEIYFDDKRAERISCQGYPMRTWIYKR